MPGVKGAGGPPPKRADQRRRRNKDTVPVTRAKGAAPKKRQRPPANSHWHPVARRWYSSLAESGQSKFYEPSDWAVAYMLAEAISRELEPQPLLDGSGKTVVDSKGEPVMVKRPPKASALSAWWKAMADLMVTEGSRRRLRLELDLPAAGEGGEEAGSVSSLDAWRSRTDGTG